MKVIIKEPRKKAYAAEIENTLEALQEAVDGYIETVTVATDAVIICDEEGRLKGKEANCTVMGVGFVGTIVFCGTDGEDFTDFPGDIESFRLVFRGL